MAEIERRLRRSWPPGEFLGFHYLASATVVGTYVLMILGAYTSAIGAGLSCPDWPACYGTVVPFFHPGIIADSPHSALQIFAEWAHRGLAMVVGVLVVSTALVAWGTRNRAIVSVPPSLRRSSSRFRWHWEA